MRILKTISLLPGIIMVSLHSQPARTIGSTAHEVKLCALLASPAAYDHQQVSFDAHVLADGMHGSVLIAPGCKRGILPDFSTSKAIGDEYGKAIFAGAPGTVNKDIHARFFGIFRIGASGGMFSCELHHKGSAVRLCYLLQVNSMTNLKVVYKPGQYPTPPPMKPSGLPTAPSNFPPK